MSFSSQPAYRPVAGSRSQLDENLVGQPRETGDVVPTTQIKYGRQMTKDEPKAKPWAHFVAGG